MWVKRTQEEIATAKSRDRRRRIIGAIYMGVFVGLLTTFIRGSARHGHPISIVPLEEVPDRLYSSLVFAVVFGLVFYCFPGNSRRNMVCPKCEKVKSKDSQTQCSCGGHFEEGETMKWV
jgi:hypothetical protein